MYIILVALQSIRLPGSLSTVTISQPIQPQPQPQQQSKNPLGSMRLTDQVIHEVDEQLTITSMKPQDPKPTAFSIFNPASPPQVSEPIDVPISNNRSPYTRTQSAREYPNTPMLFPQDDIDQLFSTSAPPTGQPQQQMHSPTEIADLKEFERSEKISQGMTILFNLFIFNAISGEFSNHSLKPYA